MSRLLLASSIAAAPFVVIWLGLKLGRWSVKNEGTRGARFVEFVMSRFLPAVIFLSLTAWIYKVL